MLLTQTQKRQLRADRAARERIQEARQEEVEAERQRLDKNDAMKRRFFFNNLTGLAMPWGRRVKELYDADNVTMTIVVRKKMERIWEAAPQEIKDGGSKIQTEYAKEAFVNRPTDDDIAIIEERQPSENHAMAM